MRGSTNVLMVPLKTCRSQPLVCHDAGVPIEGFDHVAITVAEILAVLELLTLTATSG